MQTWQLVHSLDGVAVGFTATIRTTTIGPSIGAGVTMDIPQEIEQKLREEEANGITYSLLFILVDAL